MPTETTGLDSFPRIEIAVFAVQAINKKSRSHETSGFYFD